MDFLLTVLRTDDTSFYVGASLGFLGMFFMAGAILLMLLTLLGGATNTNPLDIIYFLEAHTGNIPGAPEVSRWTFWNLCRVNGDGKSVCGTSHPDYPFDPAGRTNFDTTVNVPEAFIGYGIKTTLL